MRKVNLVLGILCVLLGLIALFAGSVIGGLCLLVIGGLNVYIGLKKKPTPEPDPVPQEPPALLQQEICAFTVAGFDYYQDTLKEFLTEENYEYTLPKSEMVDLEDQRFYEYESYIATPELVPEPDNEHDPEAIAVLVEGVRIGYVPRRYQQDVRPYMNDDTVVKEVEIYGGRFKQAHLNDDYDYISGPKTSDYTIVKDSTPYKASVRLYTT